VFLLNTFKFWKYYEIYFTVNWCELDCLNMCHFQLKYSCNCFNPSQNYQPTEITVSGRDVKINEQTYLEHRDYEPCFLVSSPTFVFVKSPISDIKWSSILAFQRREWALPKFPKVKGLSCYSPGLMKYRPNVDVRVSINGGSPKTLDGLFQGTSENKIDDLGVPPLNSTPSMPFKKKKTHVVSRGNMRKASRIWHI